jgi:hypothetical protein
METITEKNSIPPVIHKEHEVIIMHTYRLNIRNQEGEYIMSKLDPEQTAVLFEKESDVCYFILPASDTETFLTTVSALNTIYKKTTISELREKYSTNSNYTFCGNRKLISVLLAAS